MTFGQRLAAALEYRNMTQLELVKKINSTSATISRYVNDKRRPDSDFIKGIALALNVSADYLLGLTDDPTPYHKKEPPQEERPIKAYSVNTEGKAVQIPLSPEEERELEERMLDARMRQIAREVALEVIRDESKKHNAS